MYDVLDKAETEEEILSFDQASAKAKEFYDDVILDEEIVVTDVSLQYVPLPFQDQALFKLMPMWVFYNSASDPLYINAITGEYLR